MYQDEYRAACSTNSSAVARTTSRWPVGLGTRGFLLLVGGLLWLVPAWFDRRAILAMAAWDLLVLAVAAADLRRMPSPALLELARAWAGVPTLGTAGTVTITVRNRGHIPIDASISDHTNITLRNTPADLKLRVGVGEEVSRTYTIEPTERGDVSVGPIVIEWRSDWGLAVRWATVPIEQVVRVYPDLQEGRRESMYLVRSRQVALEKRRARHTGSGREFESLRDYRTGDEQRDICWMASARRGKLVTKVYQPERSQAVWLMLDAGRLQRARVWRHSMLDHAVMAALALAQVALGSGDRVGLLAYGRRAQRRVVPARGSTHMRELIDALAVARAEVVEADHASAAAEIMRLQRRRSLVIWLTEVAETAGIPDVVEQATHMTARHVVLFAVMCHPQIHALAAAAPAIPSDMYRLMAAQEALERRACCSMACVSGGRWSSKHHPRK
jgi:uncharacterized protein (DUF58 family)